MPGGFLDTFTRLVMLVLAGMVSLSIIGAIAAMSEGAGPGGFVVDRAPQPVAPVANESEAAPAEAAPPGGLRRPESAGEGAVSVAAATAAEAEDESAKWLEVIAYVLFALTGLAALLALILWRILSELRRAADASERLADRSSVR